MLRLLPTLAAVEGEAEAETEEGERGVGGGEVATCAT